MLMAMSLASVESTRGIPGIGILRYAAEERACLAATKESACLGPQVNVLGLPARAV